LPLIVVLTKTDLAPTQIYKENLQTIGKILKDFCGKVPILVKPDSDVEKIASKMLTGKICPIFSISNYTGESIP
jgi:GTPase